MRKFVIKNADGSEQTVMRAIHNSRKEAGRVLMRYLSYNNESWDVDSHLSPFDFILEEVECGDINEVITDFESAREMLGLKALGFLNKFDDVTKLISDINPKHIDALIALNKLFTIAQAWNEADEFVPDFSDCGQKKWFPWFAYEKATKRFVFSSTAYAPASAFANFGSRLCFNTSERAEQFGRQFADLYNEVFL